MRAVVQRTDRASVAENGETFASIGKGILVFAGIADGDTDEDIGYIVRKCLTLRIFEDADGKMNSSVTDLDLEVLVISQFTLLGDARKGTRPSFSRAGSVEAARRVYADLEKAFRAAWPQVSFGRFQAHMDVSLVNSGPVTILLDSRKEF